MRNDSIKGSSVMKWFVYLLRCGDSTLYTGITKDVKRLCQQHNARTASRYTRSRRPVILVYQQVRPSQGSALKREAAIKAMTRQEDGRSLAWTKLHVSARSGADVWHQRRAAKNQRGVGVWALPELQVGGVLT
jgi:putative endonuclease